MGKDRFSRKHKTNEAHVEAQENWRARKEASYEDAKDRVEMSKRRKPSDQLRRLDERLGKGVGAVKERAKLEARIKSGDKSRDKSHHEKREGQEGVK